MSAKPFDLALIVDDDPDILLAARLLLRDLFGEVIVAEQPDEALAKTAGRNPDVILLFTSGLESMGGLTGLLKVPGVAQTNAGRNRHIVEMDGQLLTGFGPRLGVAALELNQKISPDLALNR